MKFYCGVVIHETSRYSPIPTNLDSYRETSLYLPSTNEGSRWRDRIVDEVGWKQILGPGGHEVAVGVLASAQPSLPTSAAAYGRLRNEMLDALRKAMPVDAVALFLHGAQVAEGVDDCEGDMLKGVREIVGPDVPVGVVFDLHGNVSDEMVRYADVLLACLEYPHIDFSPRAAQVAQLLERAYRGDVRPVMAHVRVPMLGTYYTTRSPMREFVDWAKSHEGRDGILGVSLIHGFAWSDVEACGAGVIVVADGDEAAAQRLAEEIAEKYFALRDEIREPKPSTAEAVAEALAHQGAPVVIADTTDNPGGGAAGDSTFLLSELLNAGVKNAALGMIWDPVAVQMAMRAGEGATIDLRLGGKCGPASGAPLDVKAKVLKCRTDAAQVAQGVLSPLGDAVMIEIGGVRVVLNSLRNQVFDTACFEEFGIDPRDLEIVVVKSHQHFYQTFGPFASKVIYASPPGTVDQNYAELGLKKVRRPIYPIDKPPFAAFDREWSAE
nr:M81 family metallopeptidase [uncultured Hyphomonas sp.]